MSLRYCLLHAAWQWVGLSNSYDAEPVSSVSRRDQLLASAVSPRGLALLDKEIDHG
jgi:hypothetical protein